RFVPAHAPRGLDGLQRRIRGYLGKLANLTAGQGRSRVAFGFAAWLARDLGLPDAVALPWLRAWDQGNAPPLGEAALEDVLRCAREYGRHAIGSGLEGRLR